MKSLSLDENINDLIASSTCCLLQFGDEACGPCLAIRERLTHWLESHSEVTARYIPVSEFQKEAAQMGVFTAPTVRFFTSRVSSLQMRAGISASTACWTK